MSIRVHSWLSLGLCCLPLAWLWFRLLDHLRVEWSLNPAYTFGWAVPLLCAYLIWQRLRTANVVTPNIGCSPGADAIAVCELARTRPHNGTNAGQAGRAGSSGASRLPLTFLLALFAFCYLPTRLVQEANPEWRLISWALALLVIGLTLLCLHLNASTFQRFNVSTTAFSFPFLFFLLAVPWPTMVEGRVIQWLTGANVAVTIELLNNFGIPALQHGNIIEVTTGVVGVDEACSGIRSFQATLMLSLFFGELYQLTATRRILLCLLGFASSFGFNVGRTFILTYIASKQGVAALDRWHDPAGITVLVWCFVVIWLASLLMKSAESETGRTISKLPPGETSPPKPCPASAANNDQPILPHPRRPTSRAFASSLITWLALVEVGVEGWYRSHEKDVPAATAWTAAFPTNHPSFRELPFTDRTRQFLRYDEGRNCAWQEDDGTRWQGTYLQWNPGKIAVQLARTHTPEVCLSAVGLKMMAKSDLQTFKANGLSLPFISYRFEGPNDRVHVFYCLWEDLAWENGFDTEKLTYGNRLASVLAGRRNSGQRSLELAVWGIESPELASAAVQQQLETLIRVSP